MQAETGQPCGRPNWFRSSASAAADRISALARPGGASRRVALDFERGDSGRLGPVSFTASSPPPEQAAERPAGRAKRRPDESVCDALIDQIEVEPRLVRDGPASRRAGREE
jgi:hypothetical protein